MKAAIAQDWADALESGRYRQARGVLGRIDPETGRRSHCCLGVLCMLAVEAGVDVSIEVDATNRMYFGNSLTRLPLAVREWANAAENPWLGTHDAIHMNDDLEFSFAQIAAAIRDHIGKDTA